MAKQHSFLTTIRIVSSRILLGLIIIPSFSFALPPEFNTSYNIEKYGIVVAKSTYSLKHENNGIRLTQHTETSGLVSLIRGDTLDENSFLSTEHGQLLLTEFSYILRPYGKKNRDIELKIDWIKSEEKLLGNVTGTAMGKDLELQVNNPVWDTSSYQIPLMINADENSKPQQYSMMVKGKFRKYSFITHGFEDVEVNGKTVQAIKLERDSGKTKSPIYLWLAPSLNNIPVKIEKWKDGDLQLSLLLNRAEFPSNKTMKFKSDKEIIKSIDFNAVKNAINDLEGL